jgi:hypothetical protein
VVSRPRVSRLGVSHFDCQYFSLSKISTELLPLIFLALLIFYNTSTNAILNFKIGIQILEEEGWFAVV